MITRKDELKSRVEARMARLESQIKEAKADAQAASRTHKESLEKQLSEIRSAVSDGWENLSEQAAGKLNKLLKEDAA